MNLYSSILRCYAARLHIFLIRFCADPLRINRLDRFFSESRIGFGKFRMIPFHVCLDDFNLDPKGIDSRSQIDFCFFQQRGGSLNFPSA